MRYTFSLFLLLLAFWASNSNIHTGLLFFLGLVSIMLVLLISRRMRLLDREALPLHLLVRIIPFYAWLLKEIVCGSVYVLKLIFRGKEALSPIIITVPLDFKEDLSKVIFANSITLTPGTLSLQLDRDSVQVHALTRELADELLAGEMARRIKELES
ncbi:Na+/H+ antiporter subunit E [Thalassomonas viridans]|uniref:Na+/H+ antiporter subunit E n=1 Tax=Thalassomonas viridans TaxID=137584 RepID=A0AAF0CE58_9GAMM|nr:Na+/H+ antiporter subunit E [Thalassomonas viridans]WDE09030.1 Na+/H+ antiporter subunit E [Thalassomonas viridans]